MSLLKLTEVAPILRVSTATVVRLIRRGKLPATRIGKQYRIDSVDFARYLHDNSNQSSEGGDVAANANS